MLCVGQEVGFQDCGNQVPDENEYYIFDYKNGAPIEDYSDNQSHTYIAPGIYRVLQIANYGSSTLTDTVSVVYEVKSSPAPAFTTRSCASGTVSVVIRDQHYSSYSINFGDGQQAVSATAGAEVRHRYSTPGTYQVTITGAFTGAACSGESKVEVTTLSAAPTPTIQSLTVLQQTTDGQIDLGLENLQPGFNYIVQQRGQQAASFTTIDTIRNITQASLDYRLQNLNTTVGASYLVRPFDACGSNFQSSNTVSSIVLEATSSNEQVELRWQSPAHAQRYEIYKSGALLNTVSNTAKEITDKEVVCGEAYQYQVRGIASDGSVSISATQEAQVTSTAIPAAPYLLTTYNLSNEVEVSLNLPQGESARQVSFERSVSGSTYTTLTQVQQTLYTDAVAAPAPVCYRATFTNACGNTSSFSNISCPVYLQAKQQDNGTAIAFTWTKYEGFPGGIGQYVVELLDDIGNVVSNYATAGNTYTDRTLSSEQQQLRYRIKGTAADGTSTYSNSVVVEQELLLLVPSGFTPNGDGLNDIIEIKGRFFSSYTMRIYNNLGTVVYEGTEADAGWDGSFKGKLMPEGAYAYEITAASKTGTSRRRTGTITLLR